MMKRNATPRMTRNGAKKQRKETLGERLERLRADAGWKRPAPVVLSSVGSLAGLACVVAILADYGWMIGVLAAVAILVVFRIHVANRHHLPELRRRAGDLAAAAEPAAAPESLPVEAEANAAAPDAGVPTPTGEVPSAEREPAPRASVRKRPATGARGATRTKTATTSAGAAKKKPARPRAKKA